MYIHIYIYIIYLYIYILSLYIYDVYIYNIIYNVFFLTHAGGQGASSKVESLEQNIM